MPRITSIKKQKKENRANVYIDNNLSFAIDLDNLLILKLKADQELTDKQIKQIIKKSEFQKNLDKLTKFIMIRPRSEKEVRGYLHRKKVPEAIWKDLLQRLAKYDLINDEEFARWWIDSRQEFSPKPIRILINELKTKGINKEIIDKVLSQTNINEEKIAKNLLLKREPHWRSISKDKLSQKMLEYLIRKGFSFEIAKSAIKDYNTQRR